MLKGIDPRLNAEVLHVLAAMGHGDTLVFADANFPSEAVARDSLHGSLLRMENLSAAEAVAAVLTLLPLDTFVEDFAGRMEVVDAPEEIPLVQQEVQAAIDAAEGRAPPHDRDRTLRFLRSGKAGLCGHSDRRAPLLGLFHPAQGCHSARGLMRAGDVPFDGVGVGGHRVSR